MGRQIFVFFIRVPAAYGCGTRQSMEKKGKTMEKQRYNVTGMTCSACSAHVEKAVRAVPGVSQVTVNLLTNSLVVESEAPFAPGVIEKAVEQAGYGASLAGAPGAVLALLVCCALLAACAGQGVEVRPRGQAVFGVSTGSR